MTSFRQYAAASVTIVIAVTTFVWVIGYPQWREHLGIWDYATNVPVGSVYTYGDVQWQVRQVPIVLRGSHYSKPPELPTSVRPMAVVFDRTKNGNSVTEADIKNQKCSSYAYVYDTQGRRWKTGDFPSRISLALGEALGKAYDTNFQCAGSVKPLAIVVLVPTDAEIVGAEVLFYPRDSENRQIVHFGLDT